MKTKSSLFLVAVLTFAAVLTASAGVLGHGFVGAGGVYAKAGDEFIYKDYEDTAVGAAFTLRVPLVEHLDFLGSFSWARMEATVLTPGYDYFYGTYYADVDYTLDNYSASGALQWNFCPDALVNPFIGAGAVWVKSELSSDIPTIIENSVDGVGGVFMGGLEINPTDWLSFLVSASYRTEIEDEDAFGPSGEVCAWILPNLLRSIGAGYDVDSEAVTGTAGLAFGWDHPRRSYTSGNAAAPEFSNRKPIFDR